MKIILFDTNSGMIKEWQKQFNDILDVEFYQIDIIDSTIKADAIVSPANSFGFMDGGIDLAYCHLLGFDIEDKVQAEIINKFNGELPVGQALSVLTGNKRFPYLIAAPTMTVPKDISGTDNAYLAFRASLIVAKEKGFESIACPGLGTGTGKVSFHDCARQMKWAYKQVNGELTFPNSINGAWGRHNIITGRWKE